MSFLNNFISGITMKYSKKLDTIPEKEALDVFIYGINCNRIKLGTKSVGILSLSDKIIHEISFLDKTRDKINNIQIKHISNITLNKTSENLKNYNKSNLNKNNEEIQFIQININQKTYDFEFENEKSLFLFIKGFLLYLDSEKLLSECKTKELGNYIEDNIDLLFEQNNQNFDELLDEEEFQNLAKEIGFEAKELLLYIDKNKDGIITKEEVLNYFRDILKRLEFKNIFEKYAKTKDSNDKEYTMDMEALKLFFQEEQKEFISDLELYQLIILFKSNIDKNIKRKICKKFQNIYFYNNYQINKDKLFLVMQKLNQKFKINKNIKEEKEIKFELNSKEFSNMLFSYLLTVYDKNKQNNELDTSHSLVDYYINSSHNTYLKGHQLKGLSDPKMYSFAILGGYRLVELDCYNGEDDEIIVTHGFTLVTKLKLEDILIELRENGFKNSPYPIILSIENHLDDKHQQIMVKKLQKYLIDLYVFPSDSPPETLPTLEELKYKFIIKCGGKRLYEDIDIPIKKIDEEKIKLREKRNPMQKYIIDDEFEEISDSEEDIESENIDEFDFNKNEQNICVVRRKDVSNINNVNDINKNNELYLENKEIKEEININEIKIDNTFNNKSDNFILRAKPNNKIFQSEEKDEIKQNEIIFNENNPNENKNLNDVKNLKETEIEKEETECIPSLANIRGLLGQKFKYEKINTFNYKPWEFITLKSSQFIQMFKNPEKRNELIKLSFHCMLKAYPQNFDSSNYNIIKCWSCGCQCAAINIQAVDDDYTLFNQIFFTQNKNYGYVLKPKKFIENNFVFEEYKAPKFFINLKIINLFNFIELIHLSKLEFVKKAKLQMKVYSLGNDIGNMDKDPVEKNLKNEYNFYLEGGLLSPHIIDNEIIKIPVYEEKLGGIMIKFYYEKEMIGRGCIPFCLMKLGYRKIPIYCNNCIERERVFVVGYFQKSYS